MLRIHRITADINSQLYILLLICFVIWSNEPSSIIVTATRSPNYLLKAIGSARTHWPSQKRIIIIGTVDRENIVFSSSTLTHSPTIARYLHNRYLKPVRTGLSGGPIFQSTCKSPLRTSGYSSRITSQRQRLRLFPFDIIESVMEPIETAWEFYTARDEIRDEMLKRGALLFKKHSVRAVGFTVTAVGIAEVLVRSGVIGKERKEKINEKVRQSKFKLKKLSQKVVEEEAPIWVARALIKSVKAFRKLPEKAKFSISMSVGGVLAKSIINTSMAVTRLMIISFVTLESLSFMGVIGEPGKSLMEWADDHREDIAQWEKKIITYHQKIGLGIGVGGWNGISRVYQEMVGEEKVVFAGLASGMVMGLLV
uniref:Uncharacterized protein n=1 Tax=Ditylum brightwellii TaxID=49249 RepID=A0A7S2EPW8_9STRA|mmetsp:Transcript_38381/g.57494  ORF Transcript_38381/g.57494 Transcript_38381/m.57494 type:complete len:367 (+) Transcript_38381:283-1383(+)